MRCPTLSDLPPPPAGKIGWPWTVEAPQLPDRMPDGAPWPRISIVTPSFNQGRFIEETIRSVLLQGYPDLEYIIVDGGSKDQTLDVIKNYETWLAYWESKSDRGQAHAINNGFHKASGEIIAWINSDDRYAKRALGEVSLFFSDNPLVHSLYGDVQTIDKESNLIEEIRSHAPFDLTKLFGWMRCPQPACFWKRSALNEIGCLNEEMHFVFDLEFWIRIGLKYETAHIARVLANLRLHKDTKTSNTSIDFDIESREMYRRFCEAYDLPVELIRKKRDILRLYNQRIATQLKNERNYAQARKYFLKAILSNPLRAKNSFLLASILDTFLDSRLSERLLRINAVFSRASATNRPKKTSDRAVQ
jgi:glycosyltransferase involved in cell wall biosynthesis